MKNRDTLIIGGTGTLGHALIEAIDHSRIVVFSRDELKQAVLRAKYPKIKTALGDIYDIRSLERVYACARFERVFHVAALKRVEVLEENPISAVKTNVEGTINSAYMADRCGVKDFYFTSTDKAVHPINVYGMSKALAEKFLLNFESSVRFKVFRWGNIIGSRGSVVAAFVESLKKERKVRITDRRMTRFWLRIEDAVKFMLNFNGDISRVNFPDMKAASVLMLAEAVAKILDINSYDIEDIPMRPGEKLHEVMHVDHVGELTSKNASQFTVDELVTLIRPCVLGLCDD